MHFLSTSNWLSTLFTQDIAHIKTNKAYIYAEEQAGKSITSNEIDKLYCFMLMFLWKEKNNIIWEDN